MKFVNEHISLTPFLINLKKSRAILAVTLTMSRSAARLSFPGRYSGNVLGCQQENVKTRWLSVPISRWVWLSRAESPDSQKEGTLLLGALYAHFKIFSHGGNLRNRGHHLGVNNNIIKASSQGVNKIRKRARMWAK